MHKASKHREGMFGGGGISEHQRPQCSHGGHVQFAPVCASLYCAGNHRAATGVAACHGHGSSLSPHVRSPDIPQGQHKQSAVPFNATSPSAAPSHSNPSERITNGHMDAPGQNNSTSASSQFLVPGGVSPAADTGQPGTSGAFAEGSPCGENRAKGVSRMAANATLRTAVEGGQYSGVFAALGVYASKADLGDLEKACDWLMTKKRALKALTTKDANRMMQVSFWPLTQQCSVESISVRNLCLFPHSHLGFPNKGKRTSQRFIPSSTLLPPPLFSPPFTSVCTCVCMRVGPG